MGEVSTLPVGVGRETDGTAGEKHTPQLLHVKTENGRCGSVAMVAVQHCNIDVYVWYVHLCLCSLCHSSVHFPGQQRNLKLRLISEGIHVYHV